MSSDPSEIWENRSSSGNIVTENITRRRLGTVIGTGIIGSSFLGVVHFSLSSDQDFMDQTMDSSCLEAAQHYVNEIDEDEFYDSLGSEKGDDNYDSRFNMYRDGEEVIDEKDEKVFEKLLAGQELSQDEESSVKTYLDQEYGMSACRD